MSPPFRILPNPPSAAIVGAALGAALVGMRPVAELMYVDFSAIAMDQIVNQVAKVRYMFGGKAKASLVIRTQGGGRTLLGGAACPESRSLVHARPRPENRPAVNPV